MSVPILLPVNEDQYNALRHAIIVGCQHLNGLMYEFDTISGGRGESAVCRTQADRERWEAERDALRDLQDQLLADGRNRGWNA